MKFCFILASSVTVKKFDASLILDSLCMTNFSPNSEAFTNFLLSIVLWNFKSSPRCGSLWNFMWWVYGDLFQSEDLYLTFWENLKFLWSLSSLYFLCSKVFISSVFWIFLPYFFKYFLNYIFNPSIDFVFNFDYHMFKTSLSCSLFLFKHTVSWIQLLLIPLWTLMMARLFWFLFSFLLPKLFPLSSFLCFGLCPPCWKLFCKCLGIFRPCLYLNMRH